MKLFRRWNRILILSLLCISVLAPLVLFSHRLKNLTSIGRKEFLEDISTIKYRRDDLRLEAIHQETGESFKEPRLVVYKDKDSSFTVTHSLTNDVHKSESSENDKHRTSVLESTKNETNHGSATGHGQFQQRIASYISTREKEQYVQMHKVEHVERSPPREVKELESSQEKDAQRRKAAEHDRNVHSRPQRATDEKIKEMKDQLIRARAYLNFAPPGSNSHLVRELRLRIKEVERAVNERTKDSELSRSAPQKMKQMELSLSKANQVYPDCSLMATKLRAMTQTAEEQVRAQKKQASFLVHLAARTTPKGLHCLSMRLTADYFSLEPAERQLPSEEKFHNLYDPKLLHYAVFSDNILACAVVVNSAISTALRPEKIVFHVVTDSLNFPAISMWFLNNPPGQATIQVQSIDNFSWIFTKYKATLQQDFSDSRFTFPLNHLRFYLPDLYPKLKKILLFDHDVVVQRDLTELWNIDLKGKVIGAVETCQKGEASFRRIGSLINFSDPFVSERFDANSCTWAFGMNLIDLKEWSRHKLTPLYRRYLRLGSERPLWKTGTLPLGWATFYNQTKALDRRWHVLGLGYDSNVARSDIEKAAVIHYDGIMKPWLELGIGKYKGYWGKYVKFDHPYLQQCNIHE